jgi:4-diphosphocytidyl-2-C-methyl-D-erythritol kinase
MNKYQDSRPDPILIIAPAKLNLFLQILGRRPDGYHDLVSLMIPVSLADVLEISAEDGPEIRLEGDLSGLPQEENLVYKAARALREASGTRRGVVIRITKRIPPGGGLGGGSADAAAVLKALDALWDLKVPFEDLLAIGRTIGSDVPFFLNGRAGIVRGTGDRFDPLSSSLPLPENMVILHPSFSCATPDVYEAWDRLDHAPDPEDPRLAAFLSGGGPLPVRNDLEKAALLLYPDLVSVRQAIENSGASSVSLSGSGSCFWASYPDPGTRDQGLGPLTKSLKFYIVSRVQDSLG